VGLQEITPLSATAPAMMMTPVELVFGVMLATVIGERKVVCVPLPVTNEESSALDVAVPTKSKNTKSAEVVVALLK